MEKYPDLNVLEDGDEDKGAPGKCKHCLKTFGNLQKFLKHVTQAKACLDDHDPGLIKALKRNSRLRTKRTWYQRNKEELKRQREEKKKVSNSASKYIPAAEKRTTEGITDSKSCITFYLLLFYTLSSLVSADSCYCICQGMKLSTDTR